jgi:hypothetical protein
MPFSLADLEVGRGLAIVVGGRSVLKDWISDWGWGRGGEGGEGKGGVRRFVYVAFARVFVRHREALVRCCGMVCGVDEVSTITIIFSRVSDGRSWRSLH